MTTAPSKQYGARYQRLTKQEEKKMTIDEMKSQIEQMLSGIKNQLYIENIKKVLKAYGQEFCAAPAAKLFHSNFRGGLFEHTMNVVGFARELAKTDDERDELTYLAFLHDLGKIRCYKFGKNYKGAECVEYADTIDHSDWTIHLLAKIGIVFTDEQFNAEVFHAGGFSPKHDYIKMNRLAVLLHAADMLSVAKEEGR